MNALLLLTVGLLTASPTPSPPATITPTPSTSTASVPTVAEAENLAAHGETRAALDAWRAIWDAEVATDTTETTGVAGRAPGHDRGSAALHYNLGTLALMVDEAGNGPDVGAAVLHLLAASRRAPFSDDVRHNLGVALQTRADQVSGGAQLPAGAAIPRGPVQLMAGVLLALLGLLAALSGLWRPLPAPVWAVVAALTAVALGLVGLRAAADATRIVVIQRDTQARQHPSADADGFAVHAGLTGELIDQRDGYSRVRLENGVDVWVETRDGAEVP